MATILNIDTSSKFCSVALALDGEIKYGKESSKEMDHSSSLAIFVDDAINYLKDKGGKLDAVSVITGPGSYTGLRIGLSLAKGLAFSLDIPLITLSSLQVMAVRAIFSYQEFEGNEIVIPMMDAGRMEVYMGVYDSALNQLMSDKPVILNEKSSEEFIKDHPKVLLIGDGTIKFKDLCDEDNAIWLGDLMPHAKYMSTLSELFYRKAKFADIAYVTPCYLKDYKATVSRNRLI